MKTIKEWLSELPEPYNKLALHNQTCSSWVGNNRFRLTMANSVLGAFDWGATKEGFDFWHDVYLFYCENSKCKLPELPKIKPPANALEAINAIAKEKGIPAEDIDGVFKIKGTPFNWNYQVKGSTCTFIINLNPNNNATNVPKTT